MIVPFISNILLKMKNEMDFALMATNFKIYNIETIIPHLHMKIEKEMSNSTSSSLLKAAIFTYGRASFA